jgi:hypothetical protein
MTKAAKITPLMTATKKSKRTGIVYGPEPTGFGAAVVAGVSITAAKMTEKGKVGKSKTYKVGDLAEYDSFINQFWGPIVEITNKSVTILNQDGVKKHRLSIYKFVWRNWDFDPKTANQVN